jgi:hypothetical protein
VVSPLGQPSSQERKLLYVYRFNLIALKVHYRALRLRPRFARYPPEALAARACAALPP